MFEALSYYSFKNEDGVPDGDACDVGVDQEEAEDVPQSSRQDDDANNDDVEATIRKTADGEDEEYSSDSAVVTTGMDVWI